MFDAPAGAVTPQLRDELKRHKPDLLRLLASEFVTLRGGLQVPVAALRLALELERRGFQLSVDEQEQVLVHPATSLTEPDRVAIQRWQRHLAALISYQAPVL